MAAFYTVSAIVGGALLRARRIAPAAQAAAPAAKSSMIAEFIEGVHWIVARRDIRSILLTFTVVNLGTNGALATVIYSMQQTGQSPVVLGMVSAAMGGSMLIGALCAGRVVARFRTGMITIFSLAVLAAPLALLPLTEDPVWIAVLLALSISLTPSLNAGPLGYFTVSTPSAMLGRAHSSIGMIVSLATPLAPVIAGFGLAWVGRGPTLLVCAALCSVALVLAVLNHHLRAIPGESEWEKYAARVHSA